MPADLNTEHQLIQFFKHIIKIPGAMIYLLFLVLVLIFQALTSEPQIDIVLDSSDFSDEDINTLVVNKNENDSGIAAADDTPELPLYIRKLLNIITEPRPLQ